MPQFAKRRIPAVVESEHDKSPLRGAEPALFVAVVHAEDGVRFMTAADSRLELVHRIAEYVREWGGYLLRPDHARHLRGLLARGEWEAAVELYFGLVGKRWDKEWLVTAVVRRDDHSRMAAVLGEVAVPEAVAECRPRAERRLHLDARKRALG